MCPVLVLEGISDIGVPAHDAGQPQAARDALLRQPNAALLRMVLRAHSKGPRIFGGTCTSLLSSLSLHPGPAGYQHMDDATPLRLFQSRPAVH